MKNTTSPKRIGAGASQGATPIHRRATTPPPITNAMRGVPRSVAREGNSMILHVPGRIPPCPRPRRSIHGGVFMPPAYSKWKKMYAHTLWALAKETGIPIPQPPVRVSIRYWADNLRGDADNRAKSVGDAMKSAGLIPDDTMKQVRSLSIEIVGVDKTKPRAEITIETIGEK